MRNELAEFKLRLQITQDPGNADGKYQQDADYNINVFALHSQRPHRMEVNNRLLYSIDTNEPVNLVINKSTYADRT